ncbi:MAG: putative replicase [Circoviridae sp.]|nr:MAG: putative replicase [Circoviridae sp.]
MVDQPLPILDSEESDSDNSENELHYYMLRITPCDKFDFDTLQKFLSEEYMIYKYVVAREEKPQEHYHIVFAVDHSVSEETLRDVVKWFLLKFWNNPKTGKFTRGFGNKQYNLQRVDDLDQSLRYILKCHDYRFENWDVDRLRALESESFEKKKPSDFQHEYREMCDKFHEDDNLDIRWFMTEYCKLKAKYGQMVIMSQVHGYALSNYIKRDPDQACSFVNNFLSSH